MVAEVRYRVCATAFGGHEVDHFGCGKTGSSYEVSFIFAVFIVHDDDHLSVFDVFNSVLDPVEGPLRLTHIAKVAGGMLLMAQICRMILPVVAYGDPVLRKEAAEVTEGMEGLDQLIENMWETMYRAEGVQSLYL